MNDKGECHSKFTFQDALSDYAELSGFRLSENLKKDLTTLFYRPELEIETVCAVQYGKSIWLIGSKEDLRWFEGIFSVDPKVNRVTRLA